MIYIYILLLLKAGLKGTISLGGQEKRKDRNEEKVVGFSLVYLFPARKRETVTQGICIPDTFM